MQIYKYAFKMLHNLLVNLQPMPKPVKGDNGSGGILINQYGKMETIVAGKNAGLSDQCLHYIGGIIKHARAINASSYNKL